MSRTRQRGFSLLEISIVIAILFILIAVAVPVLMTTVRSARLRGATNDFSALLQQARMRSVQDDRYYSVYFLTTGGVSQEFVDIYPQNINGASGTGGTTINQGDPMAVLISEVTTQAPAAAPVTNNLLLQMLGSNPSSLTPVDGTAAGSPVTFGPEGLPCVPVALTGGSVCNSRGGPVAYWVFFQNNITQSWEAVTVTPAGRIQKWSYSDNSWRRR
jgi:prepilin-type N-terminal cleavage/methylation domain-containing protein